MNKFNVTKRAFGLYSPISILAFPVTVLVANPEAHAFTLLIYGVLLTAATFAIYLPFSALSRHIPSGATGLKFLNLIAASIFSGSGRGLIFFYLVQNLELKESGTLSNRVLASTFTTLIWLISSNLIINSALVFRNNYQKAMNQFLQRNINQFPELASSSRGDDDLAGLQLNLVESLSGLLKEGSTQNLQEVADSLTLQINHQLRPLSRRIWLRSLGEFPVIRFRRMVKDSIINLDFSNRTFVALMVSLALLNNVFIRSFTESTLRTFSYVVVLLAVLGVREKRFVRSHAVFLFSIGLIPIVASEFFVNVLNYSGSWTAAFLITPVAPAVIIILSLFKLTARDHDLIVELLENFGVGVIAESSKSFDIRDRHLASYIHNSLQSELLALASQLEDAAEANNPQKSAELLQKVSSVVNRSFVDDFRKFSESPLERLEVVKDSWRGILEIEVNISQELLQNSLRNASLVQTIEEFAANSFRHGRATRVSISGSQGSKGLLVELRSNGSEGTSATRGLGTEWLDQIALAPWSIESGDSGFRLTIEI
ncbi:hypothetical protein MCEMRH37_00436 [Candidatus Nanopelagicaceae bacterium]